MDTIGKARNLAFPAVSLPSTSSGAATAVASNPAEVALATAIRALLAVSYTMYFTAHAAHWNIEGAVFPSWHGFFGSLYEDVFGSIDPFAESLRQHGVYAPTTLAEVLGGGVATTESRFEGGAGAPMVSALLDTNAAVRGALDAVCVAAEAAGDKGLANFCQERMAAHLKHDWQLRSMVK